MESCSATHEPNQAIQAFDTLYTTNHMQMLKLLFPYLDYEKQLKLAVYIKWQELMFTLSFMGRTTVSLYSSDFQTKTEVKMGAILPDLIPFCDENEKSILSQFANIQNMMEMYTSMMEYMPMIQQMMTAMNAASSEGSDNSFPDMFSILGEGSPDIASLLGGMNMDGIMGMLGNLMSPEQMELFSTFMNSDKT